MHVLVTGSSGLIGSALVARLREQGHTVTRAVRRQAGASDEVSWSPEAGEIDAAGLRGVDAAVNLAGESVGARLRWNDEHKRRVLESRTESTRTIARALAALEPRPRVLVNASAVGFYGHRGATVLTEESGPGNGFLAELSVQWEATTSTAEDAGVRVVLLRTGLVLAREGGLLPRMAAPTRFGLGARFGSGRQYMSWITLTDEVNAIVHLLGRDDLHGAFNLTAPDPVTNAEMTHALGRVLHRPAVLAVPAVALRAALGEAADEMLLASQRAVPERLLGSGFVFADTDLEVALRGLLRG